MAPKILGALGRMQLEEGQGRVQYLQCEGDPIQTILGSPSLPT